MYTDPIADLLTRLRNAIKAHKDYFTLPHSKIKESILKIMKERNIITDFEVTAENSHKTITVSLKENTGNLTFRRVSKPGQRIYIKRDEIREVKSGLGLSIISTSQGLMTNKEARKANLGGELICEIY